MAYQGRTESFIAALTELGGSAGNGRLREALHWVDANYSAPRDGPTDVGSGRWLDPILHRVERAGNFAPDRP